jgi:hypothetical protein
LMCCLSLLSPYVVGGADVPSFIDWMRLTVR